MPELNSLKKKHRKALQKKGILYGIDIIDTNILGGNDNSKQSIISQLFETPESISGSLENSNIFDCLIIKQNSTWKSFFDLIMLLASCYNTLSNAYQASFGISQ